MTYVTSSYKDHESCKVMILIFCLFYSFIYLLYIFQILFYFLKLSIWPSMYFNIFILGLSKSRQASGSFCFKWFWFHEKWLFKQYEKVYTPQWVIYTWKYTFDLVYGQLPPRTIAPRTIVPRIIAHEDNCPRG